MLVKAKYNEIKPGDILVYKCGGWIVYSILLSKSPPEEMITFCLYGEYNKIEDVDRRETIRTLWFCDEYYKLT